MTGYTNTEPRQMDIIKIDKNKTKIWQGSGLYQNRTIIEIQNNKLYGYIMNIPGI